MRIQKHLSLASFLSFVCMVLLTLVMLPGAISAQPQVFDPGVDGGGTSNTGGATSNTGGASSNTGGATTNTGGGTSNTGGGTTNTGGGTSNTGGGTTIPGSGSGTTIPGSGQQPPDTQIQIQNPLGDDVGSLTDLVKVILSNIVLPLGAVIVTFFLIYSGFLFVTAQGSEEKLSRAKVTFTWTVIGAAILLGSWAIAQAIKGTLCEVAPKTPGLCD